MLRDKPGYVNGVVIPPCPTCDSDWVLANPETHHASCIECGADVPLSTRRHHVKVLR